MSREFPKTSWTLLRAACNEDTVGHGAMDDFSTLYYEPVRAFFMVFVGHNGEVADDHTQAFFESKILSRKLLRAANPEAGNFRHFLKESLRNYARDGFRKVNRVAAREVKVEHDDFLANVPADDTWKKVDAAFHEAWVRTLLQRALNDVKVRCESKGQQEHFDLFVSRFVDAAGPTPSWTELGDKYDISQKQARSRAETVGRQLRGIILGILKEDVGSTKAAEEELHTLMALLGESQ